MNLIPWRRKQENAVLTPSDRFGELRHEIDRMFDRFTHGFWDRPQWGMRSLDAWMPTVDITENESEILVRADLPGVAPEEVDVTVSGNILTLSGEKQEEKEDRGKDRYYAERSYGRFHRSVQLPTEVEKEKVTAEDAHGVLTIRLPKRHKTAPKRIPVKAAQ